MSDYRDPKWLVEWLEAAHGEVYVAMGREDVVVAGYGELVLGYVDAGMKGSFDLVAGIAVDCWQTGQLRRT